MSQSANVAEKPECKRCVNYGAECVYPVKKPFDPAAIDAALGSRHNRPSMVAHAAAAFQDTPRPDTISPPPPHPMPRADERAVIDSVPPMEMVHALFRKTKMGSFFNNPVDPPEFLSVAFPHPEDLRCVCSSALCAPA